jgi:hypothetical protein
MKGVNSMRKDMLEVASIQLESGERIFLSVKRQGNRWFIISSQGNSIDYEFKSRKQALNAIQAFWGTVGWDLQWHI